MVETKARGVSTELYCEAYLSSLGYNISIPIGEDCRYDMILDIDGKLKRIQIKSCRETKNGLLFSTSSITTSGHKNVAHKYTKEEIDFIAIYYNHKCYLVPIEEFENQRQQSLSFSGKRTNLQIPLLLDDFEAEKIIEQIKNNKIFTKTKDDFIIYQYDLNNNLINTFLTYADAARAINNPKGSPHISACTHGRQQTAYGYKWSLTPIE